MTGFTLEWRSLSLKERLVRALLEDLKEHKKKGWGGLNGRFDTLSSAVP